METIQVKIANQEDEVSMITDPKFTRSAWNDGNIMSSSKNVSWKLNGTQERVNKDTAATIRELSSLYSRSYQPLSRIGHQSASRRYPTETINDMDSEEDAESMMTDPRFTSSIRKDKISSPKNMSTGLSEIDNDDDTYNSRSSLKKLMEVALMTGKTPEEVAEQLLRREQEKKMEKKRTQQLLADALKLGKNPKDIAEFLMMKAEETKKALKQAWFDVHEHDEMSEKELNESSAEEDGGTVAAKVIETRQETIEVVAPAKNEICKVDDSDDETADSTVGTIQGDHSGAALEVKDESFTVKLISVETSENQEVTLIEDLVEEHTDDEGTIMSEECTVMSTTVLREMMSEALKESNNPEEIAAYLFKKEQERKLEKLRLEQEVTAAFKAGKSPIEIAKFLAKAEKERVEMEEERRAKKANEDLITRALKKGKTPGQIAAIIIQAEEAEKAAIKAQEPEYSVEKYAGVSEENDDDLSILTEKKTKIELEIQKLKADLDKAGLIQKEVEKLKADLVKAESKINVLEKENQRPVSGSKKGFFYPLPRHHYSFDDDDDDDDDTSFNESIDEWVTEWVTAAAGCSRYCTKVTSQLRLLCHLITRTTILL